MFTGIIEGLGTITAIRPVGAGAELTIASGFSLADTKIGDSIAVNGACLTAVDISDRLFKVDVSPETVSKTTIGRLQTGHRVNLERALRLSDRIDGHLVSGHIDGIGVVKKCVQKSNAIIVSIGVPASLLRYMIQKGSVAVDGVSLTINACHPDHFEVSIIPHTAKLTTIGYKTAGDVVNIETDMIGKYVEKFVTGTSGTTPDKDGIDKTFLARAGFL